MRRTQKKGGANRGVYRAPIRKIEANAKTRDVRACVQLGREEGSAWTEEDYPGAWHRPGFGKEHDNRTEMEK